MNAVGYETLSGGQAGLIECLSGSANTGFEWVVRGELSVPVCAVLVSENASKCRGFRAVSGCSDRKSLESEHTNRAVSSKSHLHVTIRAVISMRRLRGKAVRTGSEHTTDSVDKSVDNYS